MPHIILDYSANLEQRTDMAGFCDHIREAASQIAAFPTAGIRVRARRADFVSIADGNPAHAYLHIMVRLRGGRDLATRKQAIEDLFAAAKGWLDPVIDSSSLALSAEMVDIDPDLSPKTGSIRRFMAEGENST